MVLIESPKWDWIENFYVLLVPKFCHLNAVHLSFVTVMSRTFTVACSPSFTFQAMTLSQKTSDSPQITLRL